MAWRRTQHWVFDMDGTLTVAVHDFTFMRQELGAPPDTDLLEFLNQLPEGEAQARMARLKDYELQLAQTAQIAPGAGPLLEHLQQRGAKLGILTRNRRDLAWITLKALGIAHYFADADVLGRDEVRPKPHPDGLLDFAKRWRVKPQDLVMVGDFHYDLNCAKAAGSYGVLLHAGVNPWPTLSDQHFADCSALHQALAR